jgi:hypothetical protein
LIADSPAADHPSVMAGREAGMAFWNSRDDDDEAAAEADRLESAAIGLPRPRPAPERREGVAVAPLGLIAAVVAGLLALLFFSTPTLGPLPGRPEPWLPRGDAVYASQRLADIAAEQRIADARAMGWADVPAVNAHAGSFAAQTPPR